MRAQLVIENLGIFQSKKFEKIKYDVQSTIQRLVDTISKEEFEDVLLGPLPGSKTDEYGYTRDEMHDIGDISSKKVAINKQGDYVILTNDSEVLSAIRQFAYKREMVDAIDLIHKAEKQDLEDFEKNVFSMKDEIRDESKDEYIKQEDLNLLDMIFEPFANKFKLEW